MKTRIFMSMSLVAVALSLGACGSLMASDTVALKAQLAGSNEVPANASTGTGSLNATLDKKSNVLSWTLSYSGLTGPVKAGHFHGPAMQGANAGVALPFTGPLESPIKGTATLTPEQAQAVLAGKWYVNLHTTANPGGELRGQVMAGM